MQARKCDRCGAYYDPYNKSKRANGFMFLNIVDQAYETHKPIDLCPSCMDDLYTFIRQKNDFQNNEEVVLK